MTTPFACTLIAVGLERGVRPNDAKKAYKIFHRMLKKTQEPVYTTGTTPENEPFLPRTSQHNVDRKVFIPRRTLFKYRGTHPERSLSDLVSGYNRIKGSHMQSLGKSLLPIVQEVLLYYPQLPPGMKRSYEPTGHFKVKQEKLSRTADLA